MKFAYILHVIINIDFIKYNCSYSLISAQNAVIIQELNVMRASYYYIAEEPVSCHEPLYLFRRTLCYVDDFALVILYLDLFAPIHKEITLFKIDDRC